MLRKEVIEDKKKKKKNLPLPYVRSAEIKLFKFC